MKRQGAPHGFTSTTFFLTGGLLIWIAAFILIYAFAALACARGFAGVWVAGMPIVPLMSSLSCLIALISIGALLRHGLKRLSAEQSSDQTRFIRRVTLGTSGLAIVGFVLIALPPLFIGACPS